MIDFISCQTNKQTRLGVLRISSITGIWCTPSRCANNWPSCANGWTFRWGRARRRRNRSVVACWPASSCPSPNTKEKDTTSPFVYFVCFFLVIDLKLFFKKQKLLFFFYFMDLWFYFLYWMNWFQLYQSIFLFLQLGSRQIVTIHPSSVLFHSKPSCIVFTELIQTGKRYVRQVTLIDQDWIEELPKETLTQLRHVNFFLFNYLNIFWMILFELGVSSDG